jgi:hypothetical protein
MITRGLWHGQRPATASETGRNDVSVWAGLQTVPQPLTLYSKV